MLQAQDDPNRFLLYEAYHTKDGFTAHQQTDHQAVTTGDMKLVIERPIQFPKPVWTRRKAGLMSEARKQAIRDGQRRAAKQPASAA